MTRLFFSFLLFWKGIKIWIDAFLSLSRYINEVNVFLKKRVENLCVCVKDLVKHVKDYNRCVVVRSKLSYTRRGERSLNHLVITTLYFPKYLPTIKGIARWNGRGGGGGPARNLTLDNVRILFSFLLWWWLFPRLSFWTSPLTLVQFSHTLYTFSL
jgi:hypothetical protein